jgi:carbamoyl-phosphate synthase large subunit
VDALCDGEDVVIAGIMQHIEEAGIHSGDSSCVLPAVDLSDNVLRTIREHTRKLAMALNVVGLVNIQFAIQRGKVFVIEVNPRASRTVPYVSKATGVPLAKIASRLMVGRKLKELLPEYVASGEGALQRDLDTGAHYFVKSPVFPWGKFQGVDPVLGPEMRSTGEVMGVATTFGEAFAKAQMAAGLYLPTGGTVFFSVNDHDKRAVASLARRFVDMGFRLVATYGTAAVIEGAGLRVDRVYAVKEGRPNVVDLIKGDRIQLIVNTPQGRDRVFDEQAIRRAAVAARVPTITTLAAARAAADGIEALQRGEYHVSSLQELHAARRAEIVPA